jgi:hypothetical protein
LPKIVNRIRHEKGEAPRAGLPKIIYTTHSEDKNSLTLRQIRKFHKFTDSINVTLNITLIDCHKKCILN